VLENRKGFIRFVEMVMRPRNVKRGGPESSGKEKRRHQKNEKKRGSPLVVSVSKGKQKRGRKSEQFKKVCTVAKNLNLTPQQPKQKRIGHTGF